MINMQTSFTLEPAEGAARACSGRPTSRSPGPVGVDGPARAAADRQAAGRPGARRAREAGRAQAQSPRPSGSAPQPQRPMAPPFRIGVMQLTMEPLAEMLETARALDRGGFDTIWLAEAYPWWRKHGMEARSSTVVSALMARDTERLTIAWGIISPYTRHPVQVAMDARVVQEAAGPGPLHRRVRHLEDLPQQHEAGRPAAGDEAARAHARLGRDRARRARRASASSTTARCSAPTCPRCSPRRDAPDWDVPVYVAATAPLMQQLGGEIGDGLLTPSITTPAFVELHARERRARAPRRPAATRRRSTSAARSSPRSTRRPRPRPRRRARDRRRCTSRTSSRTSAARPTRCSSWPRSRWTELAPVAEAMERGGRLAAKEQVTRLAARPLQADRRHARRLHPRDRGVPRRRAART